MNAHGFVRIDREHRNGERHYVVHTTAPTFALELAPEHDARGQVTGGTFKRLCVPNSWAGDYGRYAAMLAEAQEFFADSCAQAPAIAGRFRTE
jgi:hypothetical protein